MPSQYPDHLNPEFVKTHMASQPARKTINDQFESYLKVAIPVGGAFNEKDRAVLKEFFFAGYRVCFEGIQHAMALPDGAVELVFERMVQDLAEHYPNSAKAVSKEEGPN